MSGNLSLYNKVRQVPAEAQKEIKAGRLRGFTDINPMWRLKVLTEQFGQCGVGWYYEISNRWLDEASGEIAAFIEIKLYYKVGDGWSAPIYGIGGSMLAAKESKGIHVSDECYKMALTDAISVACKSLGVGADIYFDKDKSKYDNARGGAQKEDNKKATKPTANAPLLATKDQLHAIYELYKGGNPASILEDISLAIGREIGSSKELTAKEADFIIRELKGGVPA